MKRAKQRSAMSRFRARVDRLVDEWADGYMREVVGRSAESASGIEAMVLNDLRNTFIANFRRDVGIDRAVFAQLSRRLADR